MGKVNNVLVDVVFKLRSKREVINIKDIVRNFVLGNKVKFFFCIVFVLVSLKEKKNICLMFDKIIFFL